MTDLRTAPKAGSRRPSVDPRMAQRWIEARRDEGRRRLRLLVGVAVAAAVAVAVVGLIYSPAFELRHVQTSETLGGGRAGTARPAGAPSDAQLATIAGLSHDPLMIDSDPASARRRLDADSWLGDAVVARHWPDSAVIRVTVRVPVAAFALGPANAPTGYAEVDSTGRVLADSAIVPVGSATVKWSGPVPAPGGWLPGTAGVRADPASAPTALADLDAASDAADVPSPLAAALAVLSSLPASLRADVLSVATTPQLSLLVVPPSLPGPGVEFVFGDGSQLQAKVTALQTLVGQADLTGVTSVDLTVPSRPEAAGAPG
jgi:hypothetical protein